MFPRRTPTLYPIRDVIDKMQGAEYWTTLDAASAYWAMPLNADDEEKTAFTVPRGKFEFNVTPYGLSNAETSYQRMIDICLSGLPTNRTLAYMDDIFSRTFEQHMKEVDLVFQRLREANISLKLSKCVFGSKSVEFLGYELSREGIKPLQRLTSTTKGFQRPETKKEVKRFLGMAGFYRNFIPKFANISKHLNEQTSDKVHFTWDEKCEHAFVSLKQKLSSEPLLAFPRLGEEFMIDVDASDTAFGGVLLQKGVDSKWHPVAYFSDSIKPSQQNWAATTKEAFALVLATRHWYVYLAGTHFVLNSDHNPLVYLRNLKDPRGKIGRWILELEEFNYTVKYIRGIDNVKADALSLNRNSNTVQPLSRFEGNIYVVNSGRNSNEPKSLLDTDKHFFEQLKVEEDSDPIINTAKKSVETGIKVVGRLKRVATQLRVIDGVLTKSGRPIVPATLRNYVIARVHDTAHFGTAKTYSILKERVFWSNMFRCVENFVSLPVHLTHR